MPREFTAGRTTWPKCPERRSPVSNATVCRATSSACQKSPTVWYTKLRGVWPAIWRSNALLAVIPLAPTFAVASALLFARSALSQMDVPTRQAYIAALVAPAERTAAVAYTSTARYTTRPFGALLAGLLQPVSLGLSFFIAGGLKCVYDLALWAWFRRVPLPEEPAPAPASVIRTGSGEPGGTS